MRVNSDKYSFFVRYLSKPIFCACHDKFASSFGDEKYTCTFLYEFVFLSFDTSIMFINGNFWRFCLHLVIVWHLARGEGVLFPLAPPHSKKNAHVFLPFCKSFHKICRFLRFYIYLCSIVIFLRWKYLKDAILRRKNCG